MPKVKWRITDARPIPSPDPNRRGKVDMLISWIEDEARPYSLGIPQEDYTPEKGRMAVEGEARKHASIIHMEGEVSA